MTEQDGAEPCDVLVIGGGPAGSTAAALLAERGLDVVLLEKDAHPRFHIGESLLPCSLEIMDRLGVRSEIAAMGVHKPGAEFVSDRSGRVVAFPFEGGLGLKYGFAYQVLRSDFDQALFRNAAKKGARVAERTRVTEAEFGPPGGRARVTARQQDGTTRLLAPRFVLDASGRDTFLAGKQGSRQADRNNNTAAVYAHFRDVEARSGETEGYISIHLAEDGWFWLIPLPGGIMSVGFVGTQAAFRQRQGGMDAFLDQRIQASRTVAPRMRGAERVSEVHATANYSYRAGRAWGEGWMLIGDAYGFIDPVFSSGVLLAMSAAERGAEVAASWLRDPAEGRAAARRAERQARADMRGVSWLIYRINDPVMRSMFMAPRNLLGMRDGLISILAGNLAGHRQARLPVLAFKALYGGLLAARALGWRDVQGEGARP